MRTTLALDDDAFLFAQQMARREKLSLGSAVSVLIRRAHHAPLLDAPAVTGKYSLYPKRPGEVVTSEDIYRLLDQADVEAYT
jgi:hypothetical protein